MSPRHLLPLILLAVACNRQPPTETASRGESPLAEVRHLLTEGKLDEALVELQGVPDSPESLYLRGMVWARKAKTAPPPTPPPPPSPQPRNFKPEPAPEFKQEELLALELFEESAAQNPGSWPVKLAMAELLAPHAEQLFDQEKAAESSGRRRGPVPTPTPEDGVDYSPQRVIGLYTQAMQAKGSAPTTAERLIEFALRVERLDAAEAAHLDLIERDPEKAGPLVRHGDFLLEHADDAQAALGRYKQAMIWAPDDDEIRKKVLRLYVAWAEEHYQSRQWIGAERNFQEARKYVRDWTSPEGRKVQQYLETLRRRR